MSSTIEARSRFPTTGETLTAATAVLVTWADGSLLPAVIATAADDHYVVQFGNGESHAVGRAFVLRAGPGGG